MVSFYVDKIDKPKAVEKYLHQLTAHKGMPYLFICGTFIGSKFSIPSAYAKYTSLPFYGKLISSMGNIHAGYGEYGTELDNRESDSTDLKGVPLLLSRTSIFKLHNLLDTSLKLVHESGGS